MDALTSRVPTIKPDAAQDTAAAGLEAICASKGSLLQLASPTVGEYVSLGLP